MSLLTALPLCPNDLNENEDIWWAHGSVGKSVATGRVSCGRWLVRVPTSTRYFIGLPVSFMFPEMYQRDGKNTRHVSYYVLQPFWDKGFPKRFVQRMKFTLLTYFACTKSKP